MDERSKREIERFAQGYIHENESADNLIRWGFKAPPDPELLDTARQEFIRGHNEAVELYSELHKIFAAAPDRAAVSRLRAELWDNLRFMECRSYILQIVKNKMNWIDAILRVEALAMDRDSEALNARIEAKRKAELEEMAALPGYGMF